jgi:hypothetical protein
MSLCFLFYRKLKVVLIDKDQAGGIRSFCFDAKTTHLSQISDAFYDQPNELGLSGNA